MTRDSTTNPAKPQRSKKGKKKFVGHTVMRLSASPMRSPSAGGMWDELSATEKEDLQEHYRQREEAAVTLRRSPV